MKHYIDKDAVVAEIERRMKLRQYNYGTYSDVCDFVAFEELEYFHDEFLPTLEVKEVDLDKLSDDITNKVVGNYHWSYPEDSIHNAYWTAFREGVINGLMYRKEE